MSKCQACIDGMNACLNLMGQRLIAAQEAAEVGSSQAHNSDYAAALRVRKSYLEIFFPGNINDPFSNWCEERINSSKAPNCATR